MAWPYLLSIESDNAAGIYQRRCCLLSTWNEAGGLFLSTSMVVMVTVHMGVSKHRGTPKWMVYSGKPYKNRWFGGTIIFGNTHIERCWFYATKETLKSKVLKICSCACEDRQEFGDGIEIKQPYTMERHETPWKGWMPGWHKIDFETKSYHESRKIRNLVGI